MKSPRLIADRRGHPPGRPCASESAARVESLLDVAGEVFMERGYEGTSLDEITRRAGASKQTLYARFSSKSDLFKAVMRRKTENAHLRFSDILLSDKPIEMVLEEFGRELAEKVLNAESRRLIRTLTATVDSFPELARSFWDFTAVNGRRILSNYLRVQIKLGAINEVNPELASDIFHGMMLGYFHLPAQLEILPVPSMDERQVYVRESVRVFLNAYASPDTLKRLESKTVGSER